MSESMIPELFGMGCLAAGYGWAWWRDRRDVQGDDLEAARRAYVDGEISLSEFERRVQLHLDPEADRIREAVEPINGIGPSTSAAIAERFATVDAVEQAEQRELEAVPGVGPDRAEAIRERLRG